MALGLRQGLAPVRPAVATVPPGVATDWGSFDDQSAFPVNDLRKGDVAYSAADVVTYRYYDDTATWRFDRATWDGTTAGQTEADLPASDIEDGAIAVVGAIALQWSDGRWVVFRGPEHAIGTTSSGSAAAAIDFAPPATIYSIGTY